MQNVAMLLDQVMARELTMHKAESSPVLKAVKDIENLITKVTDVPK